MTKPRTILSKIAHSQRLKSFRTNAALILATLMLMVAVAAATTVATAQTYTDLYNFDGTRGASPNGVLAQGRDGNLYGTTYEGGTFGYGVVFRITSSGKVDVMYNFDGVHGANPAGGLTLGTDGNFYGTTQYGGDENDYGTIFKITKSGSLTTLYRFSGVGALRPLSAPIQAADGNFYGTTSGAGYKITSSGTFTTLGSLPYSAAPLLQGTDGNFYGTSYYGGKNGQGTVSKMTPKGHVTTVYTFGRHNHGLRPAAPVIQGSDGNFYGTTTASANGSGVVFKLTAQRTLTVLHFFANDHHDGEFPTAGLVQATDGNFYGVTSEGGATDSGVVFQITPSAYSILYNFDGTLGKTPYFTPMQHTNGKIYGLTRAGGTHNGGVFYSFDLGLAPFVSLVSPSGKVGKTVEVLGQGFTGTTAVSFNGTAATFTVVSDTYLKTKVPSGATTGFVTVTTPGGALTSNKQFWVKP